MAKLYYTQVPSIEDLQQTVELMHPSTDHLTLYSHVLLRKITTELDINLDNFFSKFNLSAGRFTLMSILFYVNGGMMPSELAIKVGVTQATISGLINSLEKANLVKRTTHEKDGRSFVITLTEEGLAKCKEIMPLYHERISLYLNEFSVEEKNKLNESLARVIKSIPKLGGETTSV